MSSTFASFQQFDTKQLIAILLEFLASAEWAVADGDAYNFEVSLRPEEERSIKVQVTPNDLLTIVAVTQRDQLAVGTHYRVLVAVGTWEPPDESGLFGVGKCFAEFFFNSDLSFYNVELFHDRMCFSEALLEAYPQPGSEAN